MGIKSNVNFVMALVCTVCLIVSIVNQRDAFVIGFCAVAAVANLICAFCDEEGN